MIIYILALLGVGILIFIFYPLFSGNPDRIVNDQKDNGLDNLQVKKERIFDTILDLDFEYNMGRITEEDYHRLRNEYKMDAAQLLEKIDSMEKSTMMYDEWIERAVEFYKKDGGHQTGTGRKICPTCRSSNAAENKFCTNCGKKFD